MGKIWKDWNSLDGTERIRVKELACILGVLLLIFLLGGHFLIHLLKPDSGVQKEEPTPEPYVPVVQELHNVWIMEVGEEKLLLFRDGAEESYSYASLLPDPEWREQIADVVLTDGQVSDVLVKTEKLRGTILGASDLYIEVDGYGRLPLSADFRGYRIYDTLKMCTQRDLVFGYDFADLVLDDGQICAVLMAREETMESIRVLIKTADFSSKLHQKLVLTADTDFVIRYGENENKTEEMHSAGDEVIIESGSAYFVEGRVVIEPAAHTGKLTLKNVDRSLGIPAYRGYLELIEVKGGFAVVNVVPLEEYLYSVVPSEMPASYPREALKAQAVCARTYAYGHMLHAAYPTYGAHVDDSTSYQVYNNVAEHESTTTAVKETYGQLLYTAEGSLAGTYYYSTSCGVGGDANIWKTEEAKTITYLKAKAINPSDSEDVGDIGIGEYLREEEHFAEFITSVNPDDFEAEEGWYRWTYQVKDLEPEKLCEAIRKRYEANPDNVLTLEKKSYVSREIGEFKKVYKIAVTAREAGGNADEIVLETDAGTIKVTTGYNIRSVLCDGIARIQLQNGSEVEAPYLLPSAFFVIEADKEKGEVVGYTLQGGGFGHGVGMSQNAAKNMADRGYTCEEILLFFYEGCGLREMFIQGQGSEGVE